MLTSEQRTNCAPKELYSAVRLPPHANHTYEFVQSLRQAERLAHAVAPLWDWRSARRSFKRQQGGAPLTEQDRSNLQMEYCARGLAELH
jgi:hypothetical protein